MKKLVLMTAILMAVAVNANSQTNGEVQQIQDQTAEQVAEQAGTIQSEDALQTRERNREREMVQDGTHQSATGEEASGLRGDNASERGQQARMLRGGNRSEQAVASQAKVQARQQAKLQARQQSKAQTNQMRQLKSQGGLMSQRNSQRGNGRNR